MRKTWNKMVKLLLLGGILCFMFPMAAYAVETTETVQEKVEINATNFPGLHSELKKAEYDKNKDGYLDSQECSYITFFSTKMKTVSLEGIQYFTNLNCIYLSNYTGTQITVTDANQSLKRIYVTPQKEQLVINAPNLELLYVEQIKIGKDKQISMSNGTGVKKLKTLDVSRCPKLVEINVVAEKLNSLKLPKKKSQIRCLTLEMTKLKKLDLKTCVQLASLRLADNAKLTSINIKKSANLRAVQLYRHKKLSKLDLSKNKKLKLVYLYGNTKNIRKNIKLPKGKKVSFPSNNISANKIATKYGCK